MTKYHSLQIKSIRKETEEAVVLAFDVPQDLAESFIFQAGQYVNVRAIINGEEVRRSYSICAPPYQGELKVAVKHVPGGKFSTYANQVLQPGDTIEVMPPDGKFTVQCEKNHSGQYVFFAAGSGITPVVSLISHILRSESASDIILFYGNKTIESIMFRDTLEDLKNQHLGRLSVHHILSRERQASDLFNGRIDEDKCAQYAQVFFSVQHVRKFFICGPETMMIALRDWLGNAGVPRDRIAIELFTTGVQLARPRRKESPQIDPAAQSVVTVRIDGNAMDFPLSYGGQSILDAAVEAGADAPFSCKGGVCCTCKAMLLEGQVEMDVVYGLEPDEIEDGFILTCQSHPRTERILVDFDIR